MRRDDEPAVRAERWTASRFIEVTRGGHRLDVTDDVLALDEEKNRLRALLKQAHDRDKWQGEFPTIAWYDEVARYFKGQPPNVTEHAS
jgi:hypothetical protein